MIWAQEFKNRLEKVGYEKLEGPAIFDGYMKIKSFTAIGVFEEIDCTKGDRRGNNRPRISQLSKDGNVSVIQDWMVAPWNLNSKAETKR